MTETKLTGFEKQAMSAWREISDRDFSILSFKDIATRAGMPLNKVRRAVRALARKNLTQFHMTSFDEDGETAGAGYSPTVAGWAYIDNVRVDK